MLSARCNAKGQVLLEVVRLKSAKPADLKKVMPTLTDNQRTYQIKRLVELKTLQPVHAGARHYSICFTNNDLLRGVSKALTEQGFVPGLMESRQGAEQKKRRR